MPRMIWVLAGRIWEKSTADLSTLALHLVALAEGGVPKRKVGRKVRQPPWVCPQPARRT